MNPFSHKIGTDITCTIVTFLDSQDLGIVLGLSRFFRGLPEHMWVRGVEIPALSCNAVMFPAEWDAEKQFMPKYLARIFLSMLLREGCVYDDNCEDVAHVRLEDPHLASFAVNTAAHNNDVELLTMYPDYASELVYALLGQHTLQEWDGEHSCVTRPARHYRYDADFHPKALATLLKGNPRALYGQMFVALFERQREYKETRALWEQLEYAFTQRKDWVEFTADTVALYTPKRLALNPTLAENLDQAVQDWQEMNVYFCSTVGPRVFQNHPEETCRLFMDTFYVHHGFKLGSALKRAINFTETKQERRDFLRSLFNEYYTDV